MRPIRLRELLTIDVTVEPAVDLGGGRRERRTVLSATRAIMGK